MLLAQEGYMENHRTKLAETSKALSQGNTFIENFTILISISFSNLDYKNEFLFILILWVYMHVQSLSHVQLFATPW